MSYPPSVHRLMQNFSAMVMSLPTSYTRQVNIFTVFEEFFSFQENRIKSVENRIAELERRVYNVEVRDTHFERKNKGFE